MKGRCRCCKSPLTGKADQSYKNMPARAQNFPEKGEVTEERGIDLDLYQCPWCGLIQLNNDPVDYYRDVIRAVGVSEEMREFRREYFKEYVTRFGLEEKRVLEIGAGCGEFMEMMKAFCKQVTGLEHKRESVKEAEKKGLSMREGFIEGEETVIEGGPYDGFYIMNFLEHIPEPGPFLRGIANNLTEEGVGLVEVPNMDYFMENRLFAEFMVDHLTYYTRETLRNLLEINGFEVLETRTIWKNYVISAFVRKRKKTGFEEFRKGQEKLTGEIREYVKEERKKGKKVAVWGAGHEALALLALTDIRDSIELVVDSAPFKQGRYTPASHILVGGPEEIKKRGIGAVLIMAGSYSGEVAGILRKTNPHITAAAVDCNGVQQLWKSK